MLTKVAISDDGRYHVCPACGEGEFEVWDCDGWRDPCVVDDEGRRHDECPYCGVEFVVVKGQPEADRRQPREDVPVTTDDFKPAGEPNPDNDVPF